MAILTKVVETTTTSSSPSTCDHIYDVFLSFRGVDTRLSFTNHLHTALMNANLTTFLDDEEIPTGKYLKPELESAIKASRASIIVLSKNYASSSWCLDELALILEQNRNFNQIVIPVFYHVEPTHIRKQQSSYGKAMAKHKLKMEKETNVEEKSRLAEKMETWKNALTQVSNLKGKDAMGRLETELIEEIVSEIHNRLGVPLRTTNLPQLIGMRDNIERITSWIKDGSSHSPDILTIWGMGGIGKTYLAKYVYELHRHEYTSSFIGDISRKCVEKYHGLLYVQKQLCDDISKTSSIRIYDIFVYTSKIENALSHKKVLLVLDDVDSLDQLDALLGNKGIHSGSKIIITTRDASLIEMCALFKIEVKPKHFKISLYGLLETKSLELLCIHAFNSQKPKEGYEEVSKELVKYCEGHPLALKFFGMSMHKRDLAYWKVCIKELKKEPHSHIKKSLQMSFDSLPLKNDKDLFKHIACFFVGMDREFAETILNACGINTHIGITNLVDRCLLGIGWKNKLMMHQLVQEMGRDLVRQESPDKPWKRSRLWSHEETFKVLKQKKGKGNLLGIALDMNMLDKKKFYGSFELKTDSLSKMDNLMLLQLNYVKLDGSYENFPEELRWLSMHGFPFKSIPLDLPMKNLVALDMSYSNIESFNTSKEKRLLGSLKILNLSFCEHLQSLGGFFELPALERLIVRNCIRLIKVCESIEHCNELVYIDLSYCYKLRKLPRSIVKLKKVKTLYLNGCKSHESHIDICQMGSSDIRINSQTSSSTIIEAIPRDFKFFVNTLPSSVRILSLANNNLSNESFPIDFSCLSMLRELHLDNNPIVSMPICVRTLPRVENLSMDNCEMMISIQHPPCSLRVLSIFSHKTSLRKIKFNPEMSPLKLLGARTPLSDSSFEIDGMLKIQPMVHVMEKVLHSLGWTNLEFIKERRSGTYHTSRGSLTSSQTKMYYEFGIFSTIYLGEEIPNWVTCRRDGPSMSFTIPSSSKKLKGLNLCSVEMSPHCYFALPMIKVCNITKNQTWIYDHYIDSVSFSGKCISLLSHWLFGPNEMESGDQITITVEKRTNYGNRFYARQVTKECGIGFVYDDRSMEEEDATLGYYKSWNHIIGGDLSHFQLTTGEYLLDNSQFTRYITYMDDESDYKECKVGFKAFSQKKSGRSSHAFIK